MCLYLPILTDWVVKGLLKNKNKQTLYYSFREIRAVWVRLQQPQEQRYQSYKVFSCFCNPPNAEMDYRIFNVRSWSLLCTPTMSQHNIFYSEKLSQSCLVLLSVFEPRVFGSHVRRSTNWGTPSPLFVFGYECHIYQLNVYSRRLWSLLPKSYYVMYICPKDNLNCL